MAVVGAVLGVGLAGCSTPNTLGLPCEVRAHCDVGQVCVGGVCDVDPGPRIPNEGSSGGETESSSSTGAEAACGVESCRDLDVLLLVDTSTSMAQWVVPLANSLPQLFALFSSEAEKVCSFHIGLANADRQPAGNTAACQFPGALLPRHEACGDPDAPPYYSDEDGSSEDAFTALQCTLLRSGLTGSNDEHMLEALLGAVSPDNSAEGECNAGFRRADANLVVLYISDEDDPTPVFGVAPMANEFRSYVDGEKATFISVVGDPSNDAPECQWRPGTSEGLGAETPTTLSGFLALSGVPLSHQARLDICQPTSYRFENALEVFASVCSGSP